MLFKQGDPIRYKKYFGKIHFVFPENKTYMITLYGYRGMREVDRQVDERELYSLEQLAL